MAKPRLIYIHHSPWSERVRWAFDLKGLDYTAEPYKVGVGEAELREKTGQGSVPVLDLGDKAIAESTAILDWLEDTKPEPRLVPQNPRDTAKMIVWEEIATDMIGPMARHFLTKVLLESGEEAFIGIGKFLEEKYNYTPYEAEKADRTLRRILQALQAEIADTGYIIGDSFTRADLSVASLLNTLKMPPTELFQFPDDYKPLSAYFGQSALADDPAYADVWTWRDTMYRKHRGGPVTP